MGVWMCVCWGLLCCGGGSSVVVWVFVSAVGRTGYLGVVFFQDGGV